MEALVLDLAPLVQGLHRAEHAPALGQAVELLEHRVLDEVGELLGEIRALDRVLVLADAELLGDHELDRERAEALVVMAVDSQILPLGDGTSARVQSEGLLGGAYINLEPAEGFGEIIPCGDGEELFGDTGCSEILYAQGSVDLMTLFASFASGNGGGDAE